MVLLLTVLALLLLELLAHGALVLALRHAASSEADRRLLEARTAARGAVLGLLWDVPGGSLDSVAPGTALSGAWRRASGGAARWRLARLGAEAWVAEAGAGAEGVAWSVDEARLFWRMDPAGRTSSLAAAAEVGRLRATDLVGRVEGWAPGGGCADPSVHPAHLPALPIPGAARAPDPDFAQGALGLLSWSDLGEGGLVGVRGTGTPAPRDSAGVCLEGEPWNWGDPDAGEGPCGAHRAWRAAPGVLRVVGGEGWGVVVAFDDLEMVGTRFAGLLLVRGDLTLRGGAVVEGAARVAGRLRVDAGSVLAGDPCRVLAALGGAPAGLRALRPHPAVGWLPLP